MHVKDQILDNKTWYTDEVDNLSIPDVDTTPGVDR